jgi:hypothetical protein
MLYKVELTYSELLLLEGGCSPEAQAVIEQARQHERVREALDGAPENIRDFCARLVEYAISTGKLGYTRRGLSECVLCKKAAGYAKYRSTTQYHKKGDDNHKKPLTFYGYDFRDGFVRIKGYSSLGICHDCWHAIRPFLQVVVSDIHAEVSEGITGEKPRFKKVEIRHCEQCGWEGPETDMGKLRTLMADGYYFGVCPQCKAENRPFGQTYIKSTGKWTLIEQERTSK